MKYETITIAVPVRITYHTPEGRARVLAMASNRMELFITNYEDGETVTARALKEAFQIDPNEASACRIIHD